MGKRDEIIGDIVGTILGLVASFGLIFGMIAMFNHRTEQYDEYKYDLREINDGIYVMYHRVSSSIPADNYDVATVNVGGTLYTWTGDVQITYTDESPHMILQDHPIVHGKDMFIYVPEGSVKFEQNVGLK